MTSALDLLYSMPFGVGFVVGITVMKLYQRAQCQYEDAHHPLPGGAHRRPPHIRRMWLGGALTVAVLGYVLVQVDRTEQRYKALAADVSRCQVEFQQALVARSTISAENDGVFRQRGDLMQEYGRATAVWLNQLINPPPKIAELPQSDPKVIAWGQAVTQVFFEHADRINTKLDATRKRLEELERDRLEHPLPRATCGTS